jgi:hypothetical protein
MDTIKKGMSRVFTDPFASPTGFPFKVLSYAESVSEKIHFLSRPRICDLGYLRQIYKTEEGTLGYRCPAEPKKAFVAKGGNPEDTKGRKCLCNALLANIDLPMLQLSGYLEKPLVTAGSCLDVMKKFISRGMTSYKARDVIRLILPKKTHKRHGEKKVIHDNDVVVTGLGVVSSLGLDCDEFWDGLKNGRSGANPITHFDTTGHKSRVAAQIKDFQPELRLGKKRIRRMGPVLPAGFL